MGRYTGPKNRIARRIGKNLNLKTLGSKAEASLMRRINIPPGMHVQKKVRRISDFGKQLKEKQKAKKIFGVFERQLKNYYKKAAKHKGATGHTLLRFLETRFDNVVYKMGFAPTRASSRQLINHGHVFIDGKKNSIPSIDIKPGNVITLTQKAMEIPAIKKQLSNKTQNIPAWIILKGPAGKVVRLPDVKELDEEIDEQLIVEYYSR